MTVSSSNPAPVPVLIGLGSNLAPERHVPFALRELRALFAGVRVSTIHWTRPLRGLDQPRYANGVVAVRTGLPPGQVKRALRGIEDRSGRERVPGVVYASRTLDLDLLAYGDGTVPELGLPDEDLLERDFVLLPAAELWPEWRHPVLGRTLAELAAERFPAPPNILGPVDFPLGD
ncbi:MAG: 2-amino-4-hydroxy-6-hydroxymethyldihydropteridine diphosphokinase [Lentisphaeria bacterium]|jgi:2-amino-4-hydroxy-6-hydroxymethyldihydropteridine diphosphokinase|nr:2-amino-4-hydroxy-6-hydroxymethyldihydropteridine diphosphokinase [Lentisphaeria bacterium]